jgi:hypothetical protein
MVPIKIKVDEDYDKDYKEILFFNLLDLQYKSEISAVGFYDQYRNLIVASLKRKGDTIEWQNDTILAEDEQLSPTFEELIFANVLSLINASLPGHVRNNYYHLIEKTKSLMDHRADILEKVPIFLEEINGSPPVISKVDDDLSSRYVFFQTCHHFYIPVIKIGLFSVFQLKKNSLFFMRCKFF